VIWWAVATGAAVGSPGRYLVDTAVSGRLRRAFPFGTLAVNLSGSAVLGALTALGERGTIGPVLLALVGIGFCGAFTTFSTYIWETIALAEGRRQRAAVVYLVGMLVLGIAIAYAVFEVVVRA
jgi:CrcB protein